MKKSVFVSELLLWTAALIWGLAFIAQRKGMEFVGPFTFNGIRFALGSISLLPLLYISGRKPKHISIKPKPKISLLTGGLIAGISLFIGAGLQQIGIVYTTASNAGFITSLYVVLTPLFGLLLKQKPAKSLWAGVILATCGLYFLSVSGNFTISTGDIYVFISAFFFAIHVLLIGWLSPQFNVLKISILQFSVTAILSMLIAIFSEEIQADNIYAAAIPILYGGIFSVGIAYTLQVFGQRKAKPSHAAIILSFEALFAALGGWMMLGEILSLRQIAGCILMLTGFVIAQIRRNAR